MEVLEKALKLGEKGYHVAPLLIWDGHKQPLSKWSTEAGCGVDPDKIRSLDWSDATHVAAICGPSGIVVVDIDTYYDDEEGRFVEGEDLLNEWYSLASSHDEDQEPEEPIYVETDGGGLHLYFRADPDREIRNNAKQLTHCIDLRGVGGLVAVYPTAAEMPPPSALPTVPGWFLALVEQKAAELPPPSPPRLPEFNIGEAGTPYGVRALEAELTKIAESWDADEGHWNDDLNAAAFAIGQLVGGGQLDYDHAYDELKTCLDDLGAPTKQYKTLDSGFLSGYQRPRSPERAKVVTDETLATMTETWLSATELDEIPPPRWLLPGWLEKDSIAQIYGRPKSGKSFIALDMAARLSRGLGWPDLTNAPEEAVRVAYIIAEGVSGFVLRKQAWEFVHGQVGDMRFYPRAIQIKGKEWPVAIEYLAQWRPGLVIIDTQARCTVGMDENNPLSVNEVYPLIDELRERTKACVLLVHHTNKEGSSARGSNAMLANINTEITVSKTHGSRIKVRNTAQKNAEEANEVIFMLANAAQSVVPQFSVEVPDDIANKVQPSHAQLLIRQHLQEHPDLPVTKKELLEITQVAASNLDKALKKMMEGNEIRKTRVYRDKRHHAAYLWNPPREAP